MPCLALLLALLACLLPLHARADPVAVDSLEWAIFDADVIVRGVVTRILEQKNDDGIYSFVVRLKVSETLKGPAADSVTFFTAYGAFDNWDQSEHLFFLITSPRYASLRPAATTQEAARITAHPLAMLPLSNSYPVPLAAQVRRPVYDAAFKSLGPPTEVLQAVRREVGNPPATQFGMVELRIGPQTQFFTLPPGDSPEAGTYYRSSFAPPKGTFLLNILLDARAEARARAWLKSTDVSDRLNGLHVLQNFRSPENLARVAGMLDDPEVASSELLFALFAPRQARVYPVRREAYHILKAWGSAPAQAVLYEPKYPATHLPSWTPAALPIALLTLTIAIVLLARQRPPRARPARLRLLNPLRPLRRLGPLTAASLALLTLTAACYLRSHGQIDQFAFTAAPGVRYELASLDGSLRLMRIDNWPEPTPVAFTTTPRTTEAMDDWNPATPNWAAPRPTHAGAYGFTTDTGTLTGATWADQPFRAYAAPWWAICTPFALLAAARLLLTIRRQRQRPANACPTCGYDLRATPTRCPECGASEI